MPTHVELSTEDRPGRAPEREETEQTDERARAQRRLQYRMIRSRANQDRRARVLRSLGLVE